MVKRSAATLDAAKRRPRPVRTRIVPQPFLKALQRGVQGFSKEQEHIQQKLAFLALHADRRRKHKSREGFLSISYKELEQRFGRGKFIAINNRLNLFEVTPWSSAGKTTRGFRLTESADQVKQSYLGRQDQANKLCMVVGENAKHIQTLPRAIASQDTNGVTVSGWPSETRLNRVYVKLSSLKQLRKQLEAELHGSTSDMFSIDSREKAQDTLNVLKVILKLAHTKIAGPGLIPHFYEEAASGRLYAVGTSLQSAPTRIKEAALEGRYEYDFENCHYAIFHQLALRHGFHCNAINDYLERKTQVRQDIASAVGTSVGQVKECLLALMYGARPVTREANAIPQVIGDEAKLRALLANPQFKAIGSDISAGRTVIVEKCAKVRRTIKNDAGKTIPQSAPKNEILAHLLQGAEAAMLRVVLAHHPEEIMLCQHDGFVSYKQLDRHLIEEKIFAATGYRMMLSESVLAVGHDLISKTSRRRKPNASKGFSSLRHGVM